MLCISIKWYNMINEKAISHISSYCLTLLSQLKKKKHENLLKIAIIYLPKYQIIIGKQNIDGLTYKNLYK